MAPRLPMPRITLKRRPSSRNDSPGLSSVPASIEPIITLSAPAASAFTTSPEYLMPPSAITGTSPAPRTASRIAVIWGTPTPVTTRVVQIEPGPTPTFTASTPRSTNARAPAPPPPSPPPPSPTTPPRPRLGRHVAAHQLRLGERLAQAFDRLEHALRVPVRRIHHDHVAPRVDQGAGPRQGVGSAPHRRGDAQAAVLVLVGVGELAALEDVLDGDEPLQHPALVHDRELLDAVLGEGLLGFIEGGPHRRGHQPVLRHGVTDRAVELALELQVAVGDDAHQAPGVVHDGHAGDAEPLHQVHRFAQRAVGAQGDGVQDHPRLAALHPVH